MDSLKHQAPEPRGGRPRPLLMVLSGLTLLFFLLSLLFEPRLHILHARDFALLALAVLFVLLLDGREGGSKALAALPLLCAALALVPDLFVLLGDHPLLHMMPGQTLYVALAVCFVLLAVWCVKQSDGILRVVFGLSLVSAGFRLLTVFLIALVPIGDRLLVSFLSATALQSLATMMLNVLLAVFCRGKQAGIRPAPP